MRRLTNRAADGTRSDLDATQELSDALEEGAVPVSRDLISGCQNRVQFIFGQAKR
jgi:hypothetical protein